MDRHGRGQNSSYTDSFNIECDVAGSRVVFEARKKMYLH